MGKRDRQRKLARQRYERAVQRRALRSRRVRQWTAIGAAGVAVIAIALIGFFVFAPRGGTPAAAPTKTATPTSPAASSAAPVAAAQPAPAASRCDYVAAPPAARKVGTPPPTPGLTGSYRATIRTNRGNIVVALAAAKATCTVNSFLYLAQKGYFASTKCHRLTTSGIYVLQCGDPTGTGTGGPGYRFANEVVNDSPASQASYPAGTVAMAHSSQAASNGSQFFLVYQDTTLPRDYTPFGTITAGLDVVRNIARLGVGRLANGPGDGQPKETVIIESVSVARSPG